MWSLFRFTAFLGLIFDLRNLKKKMILFLLSGKRKSGKDYVANFMKSQNPDIMVYHISNPLKCEFAINNNLNYKELLTSSEYKEKYREAMIKFGEEKRAENPAYFCCKIKFKNLDDQLQMNVIADIRRKTDIDYFDNTFSDTKNHKIVTVKILSDLATRESRGFVFNPAVDEAESECNLDDFNFDYVIQNYANTSDKDIEKQFMDIFERIAIEIENEFEER